MVACDVCSASTSWETGTAYTADEFRRIVRLGFEPPPQVIALGPAAVNGWKNGLVANSTTGWLLCPSCAARAARYIFKPTGTGPAGHVLHETMTRSQLLGETPAKPKLGEVKEPAPPVPPQPASPQAEPVFVIGKTKECPTCGKKIKAAAELCPTCQAKFEIYTRAYCTHCHKIIHTNAEGKCPDCQGSDLLDPRLFSKMTAAGTPPAIPAAKTKKAGPAVVAPVPAEELAPSGDTKNCPRCARTIKAEAKICRFCGARFEVAVKGYCTTCHAEVTLDENDKCSRCGGPVVDRHVATTLVETPPPSAAPVGAPSVPAPAPVAVPASIAAVAAPDAAIAAPPGIKARMPFWQLYISPKGRIGRLTFFLKGILPVLGLVGLCMGILISVTDSANTSRMSEAASILFSLGMIILLGGMLFLYWVLLMLIIKRFHDLNRSGWNILQWLIPLVGQFIYIVNWVELFFVKGSAGPNKFGDSAD